eukprot:6198034-Pleurochrysis_carterae.AAC.1
MNLRVVLRSCFTIFTPPLCVWSCLIDIQFYYKILCIKSCDIREVSGCEASASASALNLRMLFSLFFYFAIPFNACIQCQSYESCKDELWAIVRFYYP